MGTTVGMKNLATDGTSHMSVCPPAMSLCPPTPPAGPIPTPFPYNCRSRTASKTASKLKAGNKKALVKLSEMSVDPPGNTPSQPTGGDVLTHAVKKTCTVT